MKISQWALPAVAVGSRLDKNWNKNRPLYNAVPARSYSDLSTLFPRQMRHDPSLFQRAEARYFPEIDGKRQFNPIKNHRAIESDFFCTQESMFLIHKTSDYNAFNTIDFSDFALNDQTCNVASQNLAWFATDAIDMTWGESTDGQNWYDNFVGQVDPLTGTAVEYVAAIIPLDGCGTTAEMGVNDAGEDIVIFKNKVRNGAYSVISQPNDPLSDPAAVNAGSHNGITIDAIVDFDVQCEYVAAYETTSLGIEADQANLIDSLQSTPQLGLEFDVKFLSQTTSRKVTPEVISVSNDDDTTIYFTPLDNPSIQVGETAYFSIRLKTPNDLIKMQVDSCQMINNHAGEFTDDPPLSYEFITGNCPDIYTNTKIIMDGSEDGLAVISFTMFEFVDAQLQPMALQNNSLRCSLKICAKEGECPGQCPNDSNLN